MIGLFVLIGFFSFKARKQMETLPICWEVIKMLRAFEKRSSTVYVCGKSLSIAYSSHDSNVSPARQEKKSSANGKSKRMGSIVKVRNKFNVSMASITRER